MAIELRRRIPGSNDDEAHFRWQADPIQVATTVKARTRPEFDEWVARIDDDPSVVMRMIYREDELVGAINTFPLEDGRYIGYRVDNAAWGQGIASEAIRLMLELDPLRPLCALVLESNVASVKALQRNGFRRLREQGSDDGPEAVLILNA